MSYPKAMEELFWYKNLETIDIRSDSLANIKANYLEYDCKNKYDMIITNPPFNIALDIIKKALNDVNESGYVIMLLRLNFLGSKQRFKFWENNKPKYIFVHHKRMSFTENGGTDSIEYAHFVWQRGYYGDTRLYVI